MLHVRDQRGLSIVEALVATALTGVILLGAGEAIHQFSKQSKKYSSKVFDDINNSMLTKNFSTVMQSASIATQFEHLPIPVTGCPQNSDDTLQVPCLRQLDSNNRFVSIDFSSVKLLSDGTNPEKMEFFRDDDAAIVKTLAWGNQSSAILQSTKPVILSDTAISSNYYATWPLVDETSSPFIVLSHGGSSLNFIFDSATHMSATNLISSDTPYSFFLSKQKIPAQDLERMSGSLILIYNAFNSQHYYFQLVGDHPLDCSILSSKKSQCIPYKYWTEGDGTESDKGNQLANARFTDLTLNHGYYEYAFKLKPVTDSGHFVSRYLPERNVLSAASNPSINWNIQSNRDFFLFLTQVPSIYESSNIDYQSISGSPNQSMDLRYWDHYYTMTGNSSDTQLSAMPVTAQSYFLKKSPLKTGTSSKFDLMMTTFNENSDSEIVIMPQVPGKVVFARKLGTSDFTIFLYQPKGSI
jgi:hypothetical protein